MSKGGEEGGKYNEIEVLDGIEQRTIPYTVNRILNRQVPSVAIVY